MGVGDGVAVAVGVAVIVGVFVVVGMLVTVAVAAVVGGGDGVAVVVGVLVLDGAMVAVAVAVIVDVGVCVGNGVGSSLNSHTDPAQIMTITIAPNSTQRRLGTSFNEKESLSFVSSSGFFAAGGSGHSMRGRVRWQRVTNAGKRPFLPQTCTNPVALSDRVSPVTSS